LPVFRKALFVDVDNHDSRWVSGARPEALFEIKNSQAQFRYEAQVQGAH
jgi:hypothetical protein